MNSLFRGRQGNVATAHNPAVELVATMRFVIHLNTHRQFLLIRLRHSAQPQVSRSSWRGWPADAMLNRRRHGIGTVYRAKQYLNGIVQALDPTCI